MKKKLYSFMCLALSVLIVARIFYTVYRDSHGYLGVHDMAKWSVDENGRLTVSGSGIIGHDID